ncbi:MAG: DNA translocase FtsK [Firmicutes bacterium]|nr:DNA translocase FtsK [Bacillota bacterium]
MLLLLINTPVSRFVAQISDKMEERRLIKEHAHLDTLEEIEEPVSTHIGEVAEDRQNISRRSVLRKKEVKVLNSSVLEEQDEEPEVLESSAEPEETVHVSEIPVITMSDKTDKEEQREYIPPSRLTAVDGGDVITEKQNSILKYMQDDSLFGEKPKDSMGLEDRTDYGQGYGLEGALTHVVSDSNTSYETEVMMEEPIRTASKTGECSAYGYESGSVSAGHGRSENPPLPSDSFVKAKPAAAVTAEGATGTAAAEVQQKISNKEAREAMLTKEELEQAPKPVRIYHKPPIDLLTKSTGEAKTNNRLLQTKAMKLEETLKNFHVDAKVVQVTQGPTVTRYEIQPAVGVKVSSIVRLSDDIALNLEAKSIRIEAPIPGKAAVGIEVENDAVTMVKLRDIIDSKPFHDAKSRITFAVGKDISGNAIVADLKSMPHLLIAGSTGSGKSVCINSIILSLLYKATPDEVKLILVDPKVVELGNYNGIPHLLIPVVTDPSKAAAALNWAVAEMTDRYKKFAETGVRDLESYNEAARADGDESKVMPQVVIIIDELADLMMAAPSQIEESICRLAQMARAAGMHLIVATQRPSVDVITGVIKANIPSRIAFAVSSQVDSRTILDMQGAEKLVGKGDMLFNPMGMGKPIRVQGTFVSDGEVHNVIQYVKSQVEGGAAAYNEDILTRIERTGSSEQAEEADDLLPEAIELVVHSGQASVSMLQRRFRIGYNRAARIVDMMEARGIVGPQDGSRPRQVLLTEAELNELKEGEETL